MHTIALDIATQSALPTPRCAWRLPTGSRHSDPKPMRTAESRIRQGVLVRYSWQLSCQGSALPTQGSSAARAEPLTLRRLLGWVETKPGMHKVWCVNSEETSSCERTSKAYWW